MVRWSIARASRTLGPALHRKGPLSMSLFENEEYQWREKYFILFPETQHPLAADVRQLLEQLGDRFQISDIRQTPAGELESLTVISPQDFAGMDIAYNAGEDVVAQVEEVVKEMARATLTRED